MDVNSALHLPAIRLAAISAYLQFDFWSQGIAAKRSALYNFVDAVSWLITLLLYGNHYHANNGKGNAHLFYQAMTTVIFCFLFILIT